MTIPIISSINPTHALDMGTINVTIYGSNFVDKTSKIILDTCDQDTIIDCYYAIPDLSIVYAIYFNDIEGTIKLYKYESGNILHLSSFPERCFQLSVSSDGSKITASANDRKSYYSFDNGQTWSNTDTKIYHYTPNVYYSADGSIIYRTSISYIAPCGLLEKSTNHVVWTTILETDLQVKGFSYSSDGRYLLYTTLEKIYTSNDYGESWDNIDVSTLTNDTINHIEVSYDNVGIWYIAILTQESYTLVYTSSDLNTWTYNSNYSGNNVHVPFSSGIYTFQSRFGQTGWSNSMSDDNGATWESIGDINTTFNPINNNNFIATHNNSLVFCTTTSEVGIISISPFSNYIVENNENIIASMESVGGNVTGSPIPIEFVLSNYNIVLSNPLFTFDGYGVFNVEGVLDILPNTISTIKLIGVGFDENLVVKLVDIAQIIPDIECNITVLTSTEVLVYIPELHPGQLLIRITDKNNPLYFFDTGFVIIVSSNYQWRTENSHRPWYGVVISSTGNEMCAISSVILEYEPSGDINNSVLYKSTDRGFTWEFVSFIQLNSNSIQHIYSNSDLSKIFILGSTHNNIQKLLCSLDSGLTWNTL